MLNNLDSAANNTEKNIFEVIHILMKKYDHQMQRMLLIAAIVSLEC